MLPIITDWPRPRHAEPLTGAKGRQLPGAWSCSSGWGLPPVHPTCRAGSWPWGCLPWFRVGLAVEVRGPIRSGAWSCRL